MKVDLYTKAVLTVIAVFLAVLAASELARPIPATAASHSDDFMYLHFDEKIRKLNAPDGSSSVLGRMVIDLRNGDVWGFPTDPLGYPRRPVEMKPGYSEPMYLGHFNLSKIKKGRHR